MPAPAGTAAACRTYCTKIRGEPLYVQQFPTVFSFCHTVSLRNLMAFRWMTPSLEKSILSMEITYLG